MSEPSIFEVINQLPIEVASKPLIKGLYELVWKLCSFYAYIAIVLVSLGYLNGWIGFDALYWLIPLCFIPLMLFCMKIAKLAYLTPGMEPWIFHRYNVLRIYFSITKVGCGLFILKCAKESNTAVNTEYLSSLVLTILVAILLEHWCERFGPWNYLDNLIKSDKQGEKA